MNVSVDTSTSSPGCTPARAAAVHVGNGDLLAVSFGGGTNSTAKLCGLREREIKPDIILTQISAFGAEGPYANRVGFEDGLNFFGGSTVFDPDGRLLTQAPFNDEGLTYGEVFLENERQFSAYNFEAADTDLLFRQFTQAADECRALLDREKPWWQRMKLGVLRP